MQEQLISFETAVLAKEKGFNELCHSYYFEDGEFKEHKIETTNGYYGEEVIYELSEFYEQWNDKFLTRKDGNRCFGCSKSKGYFETFSAPTQNVLQKWLRDKHNIIVVACPYFNTNSIPMNLKQGDIDNSSLWGYFVWEGIYLKTDGVDYSTYEGALEQALIEGLKLIK